MGPSSASMGLPSIRVALFTGTSLPIYRGTFGSKVKRSWRRSRSFDIIGLDFGGLMSTFLRRTFFQCAAVSLGGAFRNAFAQPTPSERVYLVGDGLSLSAADYAGLLAQIAGKSEFRRDSYLHGGAVEELETRMARELGKERALFLSTGTLANQLAVRVLAGERRKVLVQQESHLYRDEGDCAQLLSG